MFTLENVPVLGRVKCFASYTPMQLGGVIDKMHRIPWYILGLLTIVLVLPGCGSSSSSSTGENVSSSSAEDVSIDGGAVLGPLTGAIVNVYEFDSTKPDFQGQLLSSGDTDKTAAIQGVRLRSSYKSKTPLILTISTNADTVDLTTGGNPKAPDNITVLKTVISEAMFDDIKNNNLHIYATPLTTAAVDLAISNTGAGVSATVFNQALQSAANDVVTAFGLGMSHTIDIFRASPVVNESTTSLAEQTAVAQYRTALEGMVAIVEQLYRAALSNNPATTTSADAILVALVTDLRDKVLNGFDGQLPLPALQDIPDIANILNIDPAQLYVPGTQYSLSDIESMLISEMSSTGINTNVDYLANMIDVLPSKLTLDISSADVAINPRVVSAISTGNTSVLLTFNKAMNKGSVEQASHYSIVQSNINPEVGTLTVHSVKLADDTGKVVEIITSAQNEVTYTIMATNVTDVFGNQLDILLAFEDFVAANHADFAGTAPGIESIVIDSTKTGLESLAGIWIDKDKNGAINVGDYLDNGVLVIPLMDNNSDGVFDNWVDTNGNNLIDAGDAFTGMNDQDLDGLTDSAELRGYEVSSINYNGDTVVSQVTSDPEKADTDGDGINDAEEKHYRTNPRDADTDDDQLTDFQELNDIYSDPLKQDTDADGLTDGLEFNFFHTSPLFADTDGDQIPDFDEIASNRNPRISDLPQIDIEVGDVTLELDYRFDITKEGSTTSSNSKQLTTTLSQSSERTYTKSDSTSNEFSIKAGVEYTHKWGTATDFTGNTNTIKFSGESGFNHSWSSDVSRSSAEATTKEYAKSLESSQEVTQGETVNRVIEAAKMSVPVFIRASNDIAFNVSDIVITALIPSEENPGALLPVATLVPATETASYALGPLLPPKGPLQFEQDTIYPSVVDSLMANPRGIIFKVANYKITDEFDRNFAFTSQEVIERTAPLLFDHGGIDADRDGITDLPERYRVAVNYGLDISPERRIIFNENGKLVGVNFENVLTDVLGLNHFDEITNPSIDLTANELYNSYATLECPYGTILYRMRATEAIHEAGDKCNVLKGWRIIEPDGSVHPRGVLYPERLVMTSNHGVRLGYYADDDNDGLTNRAEFLFGCSPENVDTDDDTLDDRFEQLGVWRDANDVAVDENGDPLADGIEWTVKLASGDEYEAHSRCNSFDSDNDGLADNEEYQRALLYERTAEKDFVRDNSGNLVLKTTPEDFSSLLGTEGRTDPLKADTDDDGISDFDEIIGYDVSLRFAKTSESTCTGNGVTVTCKSDPLNPDTDHDTLNDGDERRLGSDPTVKDISDVGDTDGDGLINRVETEGLDITRWEVSTVPGTPGKQITEHATSLTTNPDSDGDTINDYVEYYRNPPTNPSNDDTDYDGLNDDVEINGVSPNITSGNPVDGLDIESVFYPEPNDADSDNDGLTDGEELAGWNVRLTTEAETRKAVSDPTNPDEDNDDLWDKDERELGSNPWVANTDGDEFALSDNDEKLMGLDPTNPNDVCVKAIYTGFTVHHGFPDQTGGAYKENINARIYENGILGEWPISQTVTGTNVSSGTKYQIPDIYAYFKFDNDLGVQLFTNVIRFTPLNGSEWTVNPGNPVYVNRSEFTTDTRTVNKTVGSGNGVGASITSSSSWIFKVVDQAEVSANPGGTFCQGM